MVVFQSAQPQGPEIPTFLYSWHCNAGNQAESEH